MRRKVFDVLASAGGAVIVVVLAVAGALAMWGYAFTNSSVHDQLARQEIYFPSKAAIAKKGSVTYKERAVIGPYAGEQVLTGAQAKAYAYKVQLDVYTMPDHGVYSKLSAAALAHPGTKKLAALVTTSFRGTTLQGLLLEAYAFSTFGTIAFWAGIASFILAGVMALLVGLGLWHARRVPADAELLIHEAGQALRSA